MSDPVAPAVIDQALAQLRDPEPEVRVRAVRRLRVIGGPQAVAALMGALDDPNDEVRGRAGIALGDLKAGEVVPVLIERLRDAPSAEPRAIGAFVLSDIGDARALQPLITALDDPSEQVVRIVCHALADFDDPRVIEALRPLLDHPSWSVREAACSTLIRLGVGDDSVGAALQRLRQEPEGQTYSRQVGSMQRALDQLREEECYHQGAALNDEQARRSTFDTAIAQLQNPDPEARRCAVGRLSGIGGTEAVAALIGALDDPAVQVRSGAAVALGHMKLLEAIPPLAENFRGDDSAHVRLMCVSSLATLAIFARSLGQDEKAQIADTLMVALAEPDWKMLLPAIAGLRSIGDSRAVPSLLRLLDHPRRNVRYGSARALLDLRVADRRLVTAWEKLAQEPEAEEHDLAADEWNGDLERQKRLAEEMGDPAPQPHLKMYELVEQARNLLAQSES